MKTLLVLRHGKSPHLEGVADHDRPLFPDVGRQLADLARELASCGFVPETILSSTAVRALDTARAYGRAVAAPEPLALGELYAPGEPEDLLAAVQNYGRAADVVLVVGHNPGISEFCSLLTKHPEVDRLGTGALAWFTVAVDSWPELRFRQARLKRHLVSR